MVRKIVITRPKYDVATSYLHNFSKGIINIMKTSMKDIHVTDLEGSKAVRNNLNNSLSKEKPGLIFLNGHGDKDSVSGHKAETVLDKENINLTKDSIVYALSCDSLEGLGELSIGYGTKAYIGYKAKFMIIRDISRVNTPEKDNNALPFKKACFTLINSLVCGFPVKKAIELTKREYESLIRSYGTSRDDPYGDTPLIRFALTWDLEFLDACGDKDACFKQ